MRPLLLPTLLSLALAGCLGGGEPVATGKVESVDAGMSAVDAVADATEEAQAEPVSVEVPLAYSGSTGTRVCVFPAARCEAVQPGSENFHPIEVVGRPTHLKVTFTYGEQKPGTQFYAALCKGADAGSMDCVDYQTGASPFLQEYHLATDEPGTLYALSVGNVNPTTEGAGVLVFADVAFEVVGTMTVLR